MLSTGLMAFADTTDTGVSVSNECSIITENGGDTDINSNSVSTSIVEETASSSSGGGGGSGGGAARHIVWFEPNNGNNTSNVYVSQNKTVPEPENPVYEGYTFTGWYTDKDCTELYDFETKVTSSFTLYGGWEAETAEADDSTVYEDVVGHWAEEYIEYLHREGALDGIADTMYNPDMSTKRGDFAVVLNNILDLEEGSITFDDVASDSYYAQAISNCAQSGIYIGYGDGTFKPEKIISRQEMFVIMAKLFSDGSYDFDSEYIDYSPLEAFTDSGSVSWWSKPYVNYLAENKVIVGDSGLIRPLDDITRAEMAVVIYNYII